MADSQFRLYIAPLQGFTDYAYRSAFVSLFGAPDASFSPFIETHKPDNRVFRDVLPERNIGYKLIPQILGNDCAEMLNIIRQLEEMGYGEVNWNLGCPYPMVTRKTLGAGLLPHPERIDRILGELMPSINCKISVKMRIGLESNHEWQNILPVLNRYPLGEVIIHGRTAKQMYKGDIDIQSFIDFSRDLKSPVCYNGNITSLDQFNSLKVQMPKIDRWMIGRGIIMSPLLMQEIRTGQKATDEEIRKSLEQLHSQLMVINSNRLSGSSHLLNKMKPYWEYFASSLIGYEKGLKKIKKSVTIDSYKIAVSELFRS
jgi:tRNA-dihydrouridine synthase